MYSLFKDPSPPNQCCFGPECL